MACSKGLARLGLVVTVVLFMTAAASSQSDKVTLVVPEAGAYTGAYIDFGEYEDTVTLDAIQRFEALVGKKQAVIGFSSYWGRGFFPAEAVSIVDNYGAVSMIYWNPWDGWDKSGKNEPNRFALEHILAGKWDSYIDKWAEGAKAFGKPLLVAWGLEMNGNWFPWCGIFAGGGEKLPGEGEPRFKGPETFKKAYRYIVDRVRKVGASNILWVFHANNTPDPWEPWNTMANYYPGSEYVDWLGLSAYGKQYPGPGWSSFDDVLPKHYEEIMKLAPEKPFILAEWGIGEFPKEGSKARFIEEALARMQKEFPRLKAAVFWHERWQNGDLSYSNLRVNSSLEALKAYKIGVGSAFWLDRPRFEKN